MSSALVVEEHDGYVCQLTLNRKEAMNALNRPMLEALNEKVEAVAAKRNVRAVIFAGAGEKAFCAGADLKERAEMTDEQTRSFLRLIRSTMDRIASLPMPTIAAVDGFAFGGGCELALACDFRVVSSSSSIGLTECALGIIPGAGGTQRLPRLVGLARAKELIFTARKVDAGEALRIGLADETCDSGRAVDAAKHLAARISQSAPIAVESAKAAIDAGYSVGIEEGLRLEARCYALTIGTRDRVEALAAFREKRSPSFEGR